MAVGVCSSTFTTTVWGHERRTLAVLTQGCRSTERVIRSGSTCHRVVPLGTSARCRSSCALARCLPSKTTRSTSQPSGCAHHQAAAAETAPNASGIADRRGRTASSVPIAGRRVGPMSVGSFKRGKRGRRRPEREPQRWVATLYQVRCLHSRTDQSFNRQSSYDPCLARGSCPFGGRFVRSEPLHPGVQIFALDPG